MSIFTGAGVAIVTPFKEDKSIDYKAYVKLVNFHLDNSTDAIIVCGTTGESATLTDEECANLIKLSVEVVDGKIPVIAGCGSNNTAHAIHLTKQAEALGANAIMQVTPYYNKATQKGLIGHFTEIAGNTKLPVMLYNVPARTSCNIASQTVAELSKVPNIVCIKEASGDISQIAEIAKLIPSDFDIYSGNDDQVVPLMSLGGKGVVSVVANVAPQLMHDMCIKFLDGNVKESLEIQLKLLDLCNACFIELSPAPVKAALEMMGYGKAYFRSPICPVSDENLGIIKKTLEDYRLI
ncbi:MAG: 4-hydroxy-tetrahydrodipicolinate synthase [Defluviitaleaceae bacterium]|nr:4-hydroxy-tetrahydrodipicolinate synthase [Defluviitaleaceae bacterium]